MITMADLDLPEVDFNDPSAWNHSVRRKDGGWLARPAVTPDTPVGNQEPFTRRIPDGWRFDTQRDATDAAISHGLAPDEFDVIRGPRDGGAWFRQSDPRYRAMKDAHEAARMAQAVAA